MDIKRRGFLGAILAAGVAPAFVGSSILMPVRKIIAPFDWRGDQWSADEIALFKAEQRPKLDFNKVKQELQAASGAPSRFSADEVAAFDDLIAAFDDVLYVAGALATSITYSRSDQGTWMKHFQVTSMFRAA
jgi:hypothetical protein